MLSSCAASVGAWHGHFKQRWPPYRTCQRSFSAALTFFPRCLCLNPLYPYRRWRLSPLTSLATGPAWQEVVTRFLSGIAGPTMYQRFVNPAREPRAYPAPPVCSCGNHSGPQPRP
jgi:hypothetical protein